jgi:hypothetical protein
VNLVLNLTLGGSILDSDCPRSCAVYVNFLERFFMAKSWYCRQKSIVWFTSDFVILVAIARLEMCLNLGSKAFPVEDLVDRVYSPHDSRVV